MTTKRVAVAAGLVASLLAVALLSPWGILFTLGDYAAIGMDEDQRAVAERLDGELGSISLSRPSFVRSTVHSTMTIVWVTWPISERDALLFADRASYHVSGAGQPTPVVVRDARSGIARARHEAWPGTDAERLRFLEGLVPTPSATYGE